MLDPIVPMPVSYKSMVSRENAEIHHPCMEAPSPMGLYQLNTQVFFREKFYALNCFDLVRILLSNEAIVQRGD